MQQFIIEEYATPQDLHKGLNQLWADGYAPYLVQFGSPIVVIFQLRLVGPTA